MRKWMIMGILLAGLLWLFSGCSQDDELKGTTYNIYGLKKGSTKLDSMEYRTETNDMDQLIHEILDQFKQTRIQEGITSALPQDVTLSFYKLDNKILNIDFSPEYSKMSVVSELLCRGAIVMTFTQIEGIDSVSITIGDKPLADKDGNPIGAQKATDFVDIVGKGLNSVTKVTLVLYFADESGGKLLKKTEEVAYDSSYVVAKAVINRLIEGPKDDGGKYYPTLPSNLKILSVTVKDNICYVNFDQAFQTNALNVEAYIPVYSVVNSLAELPGIKKVQILVNGVADMKFKDMISLADPLERNLDYVGGSSD